LLLLGKPSADGVLKTRGAFPGHEASVVVVVLALANAGRGKKGMVGLCQASRLGTWRVGINGEAPRRLGFHWCPAVKIVGSHSGEAPVPSPTISLGFGVEGIVAGRNSLLREGAEIGLDIFQTVSIQFQKSVSVGLELGW